MRSDNFFSLVELGFYMLVVPFLTLAPELLHFVVIFFYIYPLYCTTSQITDYKYM